MKLYKSTAVAIVLAAVLLISMVIYNIFGPFRPIVKSLDYDAPIYVTKQECIDDNYGTCESELVRIWVAE